MPTWLPVTVLGGAAGDDTDSQSTLGNSVPSIEQWFADGERDTSQQFENLFLE
jgi:hypothetical protein